MHKNGKVLLKIRQVQKHHVFNFPLEVGIMWEGQKLTIQTINIKDRDQELEIAMVKKPDQVILDPDVWLLFEEIK